MGSSHSLSGQGASFLVRDPQGDVPFVDLDLFSSGGKDQGEAATGRELNRMNCVPRLLNGEYSPLEVGL